MSTKKRVIADLLFGVQVVCTLIFGGAQFVRMLSTTKGVSVSWFTFWLVFLVVNLALAIRAHRNQPSRVTLQTIGSYALWVLMVVGDLGVMIVRGNGTWDHNDTITAVITLTGVAVILGIASIMKLGISDPVVKGHLAIFFKAVPQLTLAYKIFMVGGAGLAGLTVIMGHITVLTRLGQLIFSIREAGWDRNRRGSAISEAANEGSWIIATIAWMTH